MHANHRNRAQNRYLLCYWHSNPRSNSTLRTRSIKESRLGSRNMYDIQSRYRRLVLTYDSGKNRDRKN